MAVNRADDLGSQFPSDAAEVAPPNNPITNRSQIDFFTGPDPNVQPVEVPQTSSVDLTGVEARRFLVKAVLDDSLLCRLLIGNIESGGSILVAKPDSLRKTFYDGLTIGDALLTYIDAQTRTALRDNVPERETIEPLYVADASIIIAVQPSNGTGLDNVVFIDVTERSWRRPTKARATVISVEDELIEVAYPNDLAATFKVARPLEHRRSTYDGKSFLGFTFTYVGENTRTASDGTPETQKITPDYRENDSIIIIERIEGEDPVLTIGDDSYQWIESNNDARAWAVESL